MAIHYHPQFPPECRVGSAERQPCSPDLPRSADPAIAAALPAVVQVDEGGDLAALVIPCFLSIRTLATSSGPPPPVFLRYRDHLTRRIAEIRIEDEGDYKRPHGGGMPPAEPIPPLLRTVWRAVDLNGVFRFDPGRHEIGFRCEALLTEQFVLDVRLASPEPGGEAPPPR